MKWDTHVDKVLGHAKKTLNRLQILRRNLSLDSYVHILTSQSFLKLYYGSPVWLSHVSSQDLKRLESIHYKALRIGCNDYQNKTSRYQLDHDYRRATPSEWPNYGVSREAILIFYSTHLASLFKRMDDQSYRVNRLTLP